MTFPFYTLINHSEFSLIAAVVLGFFFGFVLERAGFGRATKLAGQFYLNDMTVFKVMFSAIVTALLGLVVADGIGLTSFSAIATSAASTTYMWPMLVGGLLLGVGFIVSGYCPGTSLVSASSGNIDGLFTIVGVGVGSLLFGEFYPSLESFYLSGDVGQFYLYQWLNVPQAVVAVGVVLMAIGGFVGAEVVEKMMAQKNHQHPETSPKTPKRLVFATFAGAAALGLFLLLIPTKTQPIEARNAASISVETLAKRLLDEPWKLFILDIRTRTDYEDKRIMGSLHSDVDKLKNLGLAYRSGTQDLILISNDNTMPPDVLNYPGNIYTLAGGFAAWQTFALEKPALPSPHATTTEREAYAFQSAVYAKMTGTVAAPPPPVATGTFKPPTKRKGGGCDG